MCGLAVSSMSVHAEINRSHQSSLMRVISSSHSVTLPSCRSWAVPSSRSRWVPSSRSLAGQESSVAEEDSPISPRSRSNCSHALGSNG